MSYLCSFFTNVVHQLYPNKDGEPFKLTYPEDFEYVHDRKELQESRRADDKQSIDEIAYALKEFANSHNQRVKQEELWKTRKPILKIPE